VIGRIILDGYTTEQFFCHARMFKKDKIKRNK